MVRFILAAVLAVAIVGSLGAGFAGRAQEGASPAASPMSDQLLCATPLAEAEASGEGGTPVATITAPAAAASPGGIDPGTPVGLFECGTPRATATPATPTS